MTVWTATGSIKGRMMGRCHSLIPGHARNPINDNKQIFLGCLLCVCVWGGGLDRPTFVSSFCYRPNKFIALCRHPLFCFLLNFVEYYLHG